MDDLHLLFNVFKISVEIITDFGWLKDPIRFLPYFEFIPVFPPTELST